MSRFLGSRNHPELPELWFRKSGSPIGVGTGNQTLSGGCLGDPLRATLMLRPEEVSVFQATELGRSSSAVLPLYRTLSASDDGSQNECV